MPQMLLRDDISWLQINDLNDREPLEFLPVYQSQRRRQLLLPLYVEPPTGDVESYPDGYSTTPFSLTTTSVTLNYSKNQLTSHNLTLQLWHYLIDSKLRKSHKKRAVVAFVPKEIMHHPGIEPRANAWKAFMLPLHHRRFLLTTDYSNLNKNHKDVTHWLTQVTMVNERGQKGKRKLG